MRLRALKAWRNYEHEGEIRPEQHFEASEARAQELIRAGLAIPMLDEARKVRVVPDTPAPQQRPSSRRR